MEWGGFVQAVTVAVDSGSDNWAFEYWIGLRNKSGRGEWDERKSDVNSESYASAKGPEYKELRICVMQMRGEIRRV